MIGKSIEPTQHHVPAAQEAEAQEVQEADAQELQEADAQEAQAVPKQVTIL